MSPPSRCIRPMNSRSAAAHDRACARALALPGGWNDSHQRQQHDADDHRADPERQEARARHQQPPDVGVPAPFDRRDLGREIGVGCHARANYDGRAMHGNLHLWLAAPEAAQHFDPAQLTGRERDRMARLRRAVTASGVCGQPGAARASPARRDAAGQRKPESQRRLRRAGASAPGAAHWRRSGGAPAARCAGNGPHRIQRIRSARAGRLPRVPSASDSSMRCGR